MNKKLLKKIISASYKNIELDREIVLTIAQRLNRKALKQYIKGLKQCEKENSVIVDLPFAGDDLLKQGLKELFPNKKILYNIDSSLLLGLRITNYDLVLAYNLKDELENIQKQISKQ